MRPAFSKELTVELNEVFEAGSHAYGACFAFFDFFSRTLDDLRTGNSFNASFIIPSSTAVSQRSPYGRTRYYGTWLLLARVVSPFADLPSRSAPFLPLLPTFSHTFHLHSQSNGYVGRLRQELVLVAAGCPLDDSESGSAGRGADPDEHSAAALL